VILYDETLRQSARDGTPLVKLIAATGALPGIKVDKGTKALPFCPNELITEGLDMIAGQTADTVIELAIDTDMSLAESILYALICRLPLPRRFRNPRA